MADRTIRVDDILGTAEVAEVLGVTKQRIHALRQMAKFPDPVKMIASSPLWDKQDIIAFLSDWKPWKVQQ